MRVYTESVKRAAGAAVIAAAALLVPASVGSAGSVDWATAVVSPGLVSHRATLTLKLHYEMTCGQPGAGPLVVQLPARMSVLHTLAVRIGAKRTTKVTVSGTNVTVQLTRPPGMTCMSIAPGTVTIELAGVRNPASAGTYFVRAHVRNHNFTAQLAVRA
jgi:hypothetical protein